MVEGDENAARQERCREAEKKTPRLVEPRFPPCFTVNGMHCQLIKDSGKQKSVLCLGSTIASTQDSS